MAPRLPLPQPHRPLRKGGGSPRTSESCPKKSARHPSSRGTGLLCWAPGPPPGSRVTRSPSYSAEVTPIANTAQGRDAARWAKGSGTWDQIS